MSKLLCPKCMKSVTLPDDFTGREVTCPSCQNSFEAPTRYNPTVLSNPVAPSPPVTPTPAPNPPAMGGSPEHSTPLVSSTKPSETSAMSPEHPPDHPPAPPGLVPTHAGIPSTSAAPASLPPGYSKSHGFVISPHLMAWLPAILLTVTFICTFFPWVSTYLGGSPVNSQGLWRTISGNPSRNIPNENGMQTPPNWLDKVKSDWLLMVPYFLLLLAATAIALIERISHYFDPRKYPPLARIWPWKLQIIIVTAVFAFFLMLIQIGYGFGLERAMRQVVSEQFSSQREAASASPTQLKTVEYNEKQEYGKFNMEITFWLYLSILCNFLAVLAAMCRIGLDKRGSKPPPRIVIQY